jgi:hypothetical protein
MKLPSRLLLPIARMRPSLTATTGAASREKILMPRRLVDSTSIAALPERTRFLVAFSWPAYVERACTGNRPCVRPVSDPTRLDGRPPITCARSSTESTYQSAWLYANTARRMSVSAPAARR